jgi:hypothetical protein
LLIFNKKLTNVIFELNNKIDAYRDGTNVRHIFLPPPLLKEGGAGSAGRSTG